MYKNDVIAPRMDFCVEKIIAQYSDMELDEIIKLIDDAMSNINHDIDELNSNPDILAYEHYYGEYNKGFESHLRYESVSDVINDFKKDKGLYDILSQKFYLRKSIHLCEKVHRGVHPDFINAQLYHFSCIPPENPPVINDCRLFASKPK